MRGGGKPVQPTAIAPGLKTVIIGPMNAGEPALQPLAETAPPSDAPAPFTLTEPARQSAPVIYASPHSGRHYPADFVTASALSAHDLRASEDIYVDALFAAAPAQGTPLLQATYARAYLDVNREAWELDPAMFNGPLPGYVNVKSGRVAAGLGTIARVVASGTAIYNTKLDFTDAVWRVNHIYHPYHQEAERLVARTQERFGTALLVDCHSMPSVGGSWGDMKLKNLTHVPDFILGDRYGRACAPVVTQTAETLLKDLGYNVTRNSPYSGGYNTRHYGTPATGRHALQIEINRALYVDETTLERHDGFEKLCQDMTRLIRALNNIGPDELRT